VKIEKMDDSYGVNELNNTLNDNQFKFNVSEERESSREWVSSECIQLLLKTDWREAQTLGGIPNEENQYWMKGKKMI